MEIAVEKKDEAQGTEKMTRGSRWLRGSVVLTIGCLAIVGPFIAKSLTLFLVGLLLIACGILELLDTFRAGDQTRRRLMYLSGAVTVLSGVLLLAQPQLILRGVALVLACSFVIDGLGKLIAADRRRQSAGAWRGLAAGGGVNLLLALALVLKWPISGMAAVGILVGIRVISIGWSTLLGRSEMAGPATKESNDAWHPDRSLRLPSHAHFVELAAIQQDADKRRRSIDAYWCMTFVLVFFAIHIGRMQVEWNLVGMISPLVATVGDVASALLVSFGIILPIRLAWRRLTRPLERRGWQRVLARADQDRWVGPMTYAWKRWLISRMTFARRVRTMRTSPRAAVRWALQAGLPVVAILIAINPIWGFSWFFNSESWATEVWNRWAEARTDTWRQKIIIASEDHYQATGMPLERIFQVEPQGVGGAADFSFLVLGDTGEGDASQHCLRDQYLLLGQRPDVKFLVVSSDVIYPSGALSDYEPKFYLPFKGFTKPIYAIPGNHDWFDALEGFAANFLEPEAARVAMHTRIVTDNRLTSTTDKRIEEKIREAARLRKEFGASTGWQRGPFFELQTDRFALIAVDTGVLKSVDTRQWEWLRGALLRAKGKFVMTILGHPLYAGGRYQGGDESAAGGEWVSQPDTSQLLGLVEGKPEPFAAVHRLLREHQVPLVMAGDTHYFEHYRESYHVEGQTRTMYHFVNGGGGAYISIGTALDWPTTPAVPDCAFFPRTDFLIAKLEREMPAWKEPLWQWAKRLHAWPFTTEAVAGAFDYNRAPYLQSFVEVRVERSANRVRLIAHGANGPLRWRDMETHGDVIPAGKSGDDVVEFIVPMPA